MMFELRNALEVESDLGVMKYALCDLVIITVPGNHLVEISYYTSRIPFVKRIGPNINLRTGAMNITDVKKGSAARFWFRESDEILKIKTR